MRPLTLAATALLGVGAAAGAATAIGASTTDGATAAGVSTAARAVHTARAEGRPYDLERDRRVWEIDVAPSSGRPAELHISADGRSVVRRGRADDLDDAARAAEAKVGLERALRTAAGRASGTLTDAELDRTRGGRLVWSATFERGSSETEVDVDARTGAVVRVATERDD